MLVKNPLDLQGEAPGGKVFEDYLFLLNETGAVLASRSGLEAPARGDAFFEEFPAKAAEQNELSRLLSEFRDAPVFLRCKGQTVLFLTAFYAETGFSVALVPGSSLAVYTDAPAALIDSFPGVYFTEEVKRRQVPPNEQQYLVIQRYLSYCGRNEVQPPEDDVTRASYTSMVEEIETVARQTGCTIVYNLSGLGIRPAQNPAFGRFGGILYLLALVAIRAAKSPVLHLSTEPIDPEAPLFVAELELSDPNDPLPELDGLGDLAASFDFYADYCRQDGHYTIRWSVGHRDLSRQGVKHPSVYRGNRNPYPIHPFPEE